jgi:geranylgeranyl reductase family protein
MYDFVVVGAGPAGSRFARGAAERGRDVLVLEQGEIGKPLACSGHVSLDVWDYVPDDAREELFQNAIRGARFHVGGPGSDAEPFYRRDAISNAVDRVGLDKALARAAADAGADVRDGHTVTDVAERRDRVTVTATGPDGAGEYEARMVVGADGPQSRVRSACSIPDPGEFLHGVLGFDEAPDDADFVDVHLTVPRFFAWRIPRGPAGVEYGLAAAPGDDVSGRFDRLQAEYGVDLDRRCSGLIPIGPPSRITGRRSLLVGDAAGQTKPFTGGGILYGMRAADHAVRTVDPTDPGTLGDYEDAWRGALRTEIRLGHAVRLAYSLPRPVQRAGLRALSGEIAVHMDEPTSLFSREQLRAFVSPDSAR